MTTGVRTEFAAADPLAAARALAPLAAEHAAFADAERRLAPELVEGLRESGLFRMLVPAALGGGEAEPARMMAAVDELAHADAATGWCVAVAATSGLLGGYLPEEHAREVFSDPRGCVGGVFAPKGRARPVGPDALEVSGRWPFASGVQHSDWLMGGCLVEADGDVTRTESGAPDSRLALVPAKAVEVIDTWDVAGLRGTGSHDFAVESARVPRGRTASLVSDEHRAPGALYAFPVFGLLALAIASVGTGIARAALEDLIELAGGKVPAMATKALAQQPDAQARTAKAEAGLRAARALLDEEVGGAWTAAAETGDVSLERRAGLRLAASHAMFTSAHVVDEAYALAGGSAVYASNPLQRRFRDVHVATQHMLVNPSTWEFAGRVLLGAPVRAEQF